jgi:hypothetical protein
MHVRVFTELHPHTGGAGGIKGSLPAIGRARLFRAAIVPPSKKKKNTTLAHSLKTPVFTPLLL